MGLTAEALSDTRSQLKAAWVDTASDLCDAVTGYRNEVKSPIAVGKEVIGAAPFRGGSSRAALRSSTTCSSIRSSPWTRPRASSTNELNLNSNLQLDTMTKGMVTSLSGA